MRHYILLTLFLHLAIIQRHKEVQTSQLSHCAIATRTGAVSNKSRFSTVAQRGLFKSVSYLNLFGLLSSSDRRHVITTFGSESQFVI